MTTHGHTPGTVDTTPDKFELHYRQQLSALVDGELAADEARFLLRRLEHDEELAACQERWQLLGDVLRGQACAPAPLDFGQRVREAVAADMAPPAGGQVAQARRGGWKRWGGGAALAASVAAVALFMAREQLPDAAPVPPTTVIATTAQVPAAPAVAGADTDVAAPVVAGTAAAVAVAAARQDARRGSATRNHQAARAAARQAEPERVLAVQAAPLAEPVLRQDPFTRGAGVLQARPWPRSDLGPALSQGAFNASLPAGQPGGAFYPFEPRLPVQAVEAPAGASPEPDARH